MIGTILTPIDGSKHAQAALGLGISLAAKYKAKLLILHVGLRDGDVPDALYDTAARELDEAESSGQDTGIYPHSFKHLRVLEYMGHMLLRNAKAKADDSGVKSVETVINFGDAGERILYHARHAPATLIVMGCRGFNKLEGILLGSVSHKVPHLAPCSCITVRPSHGDETFDTIESIVAPIDGSDHAAMALDLACDLALKYGARLTLLHVTQCYCSLDQLGALVDMDQLSEGTRKELDPARKAAPEQIGDLLLPLSLSFHAVKDIGNQILAAGQRVAKAKGVESPNLLLLQGDPAGRILDTAKREQTDLIVMGSRGLGEVTGLLAGSASYKVNHAAPCSCLVVRWPALSHHPNCPPTL